MSRTFKAMEIVLLATSAVSLATLAVAHFTVAPAMLEVFTEYGSTLPTVTRIALSSRSLLAVEVVGLALFLAAAVCLWRAKRMLAVALGALSLAVTFAASLFFLYAMSLPAANSVVVP
ncbi:MAG TPA: hypothetical protein VFK05_07100 [Polyangiaceae bacterium]|nr:hypothetical protein [Polyangiaceae bacterium]